MCLFFSSTFGWLGCSQVGGNNCNYWKRNEPDALLAYFFPGPGVLLFFQHFRGSAGLGGAGPAAMQLPGLCTRVWHLGFARPRSWAACAGRRRCAAPQLHGPAGLGCAGPAAERLRGLRTRVYHLGFAWPRSCAAPQLHGPAGLGFAGPAAERLRGLCTRVCHLGLVRGGAVVWPHSCTALLV